VRIAIEIVRAILLAAARGDTPRRGGAGGVLPSRIPQRDGAAILQQAGFASAASLDPRIDAGVERY